MRKYWVILVGVMICNFGYGSVKLRWFGEGPFQVIKPPQFNKLTVMKKQHLYSYKQVYISGMKSDMCVRLRYIYVHVKERLE